MELYLVISQRWAYLFSKFNPRKKLAKLNKKIQKLTNEIADQRLIDRNIKRLDDIINSRTKHNWQCLIKKCQYIWKTTPNNILNKKQGCPQCAGNAKLTNEIVDQKLIGRNINRLEDIISCLTKYDWQCLIINCEYIWKTSANNILNNNTGCPKCSGLVKLANKVINQRLIGRNIKLLDDMENGNSKTKRKWKCLIINCKYIWKARLNDILNNNSGCPKCYGNIKLTNEEIDRRLIDRDLKRLDDIENGNKTKKKWQCLIEDCQYIWETSSDAILNKKQGCPKCAGNIKLTNEDIDQRLIGRNIKRLDGFINNKTKHNWQCLIEDCNHIWQTTSDSILNFGSGCPKCSQGKNEKLIGLTFNKLNINFEQQKNIRILNNKELRNLKLDYYLPDFNIAIEYNGEQHYRPVCFGGISIKRAKENFIIQQERDEYKRIFCNTNYIKLIEIDGCKYKNKKLENHVKELITQINKKEINNGATINTRNTR